MDTVINLFSKVYIFVGITFAISCLVIVFCIGILVYRRKVWSQHSNIILVCVGIFSVLFILYIAIRELPILKLEKMLKVQSNVSISTGLELVSTKYNLIYSFENRRYIKLSGSHPTRFFDLKVEAEGKKIEFKLGRDSRNENMYWVYFPKYKYHGSLCYIEIKKSIGSVSIER